MFQLLVFQLLVFQLLVFQLLVFDVTLESALVVALGCGAGVTPWLATPTVPVKLSAAAMSIALLELPIERLVCASSHFT